MQLKATAVAEQLKILKQPHLLAEISCNRAVAFSCFNRTYQP